MISHQENRSGWGNCLLNKAWLVLAAALLLSAPPARAAEYQVSGDSNTFLRMRNTVDDKNIYPLYEYLRLSVTSAEKDGSAISLHTGAWGRVDLGDKWSDDRADGDLQYGYLSYRGANNNLTVNAGRQFVTEGVAVERVDGLYLRSDLAAGFGAAAFLGSPVVTEPNFNGGEFLFGGRLSHSYKGLYWVGLSALKSEGENDSRDREEQGIDLWLHPVKQLDLTGRSSHNSLTSGWMEHAYTLSFAPLEMLTLSGDFQQVNYDDYFFHVTTSALSLTNGIIVPGEKMTAAGARVALVPVKNLTLSGDYRNYHYSIAGDAHYGGGGLSYALPSLTLGVSGHRMYGAIERLRYYEARCFALAKLGAVDLAAEFFNINYDQRINGVKNSLALTGSAGYRFNEKLRVWADLEYSQSPDFDDEVRGLVKLAYAFDMARSEGGKSEK